MFVGGYVENMPDWIIQMITATGIGIIGYFLKSYKTELSNKDTQLEQKDAKLEAEIDSLKKSFNQYKLDASDHFVKKDDFIRASAQTDRKLDKIYDELIKLNKNAEAKQ